MEGKHEDQPRGGLLLKKNMCNFLFCVSIHIFSLTFQVGLFKKWKQEQGRSKKQLRVKQEDYDDEDEEEDDRNEEDGDEDEEDEDEDEVDEREVIENKSNKKISSKKEENEDESDGYDDPEEEEEDEEEDEYPEGVTEYDPPDSLHSCTDITMTDRLLDRLNTLNGVLKFQELFLTQTKPSKPLKQGEHSFKGLRKIER